MMIKNIKKLKNFGIFQNHTNANLKDFGKYNLLYGWNGSGKSTLASLFRSIERQKKSEKFPTAEFSISIENGSTITHENVGSTYLNIYTFNQDFIDENISWNDVVNSILLVDKKKIEERKKLEELNLRQISDKETYDNESKEINSLESAISSFGTSGARRMKMSLQSIDTTDNHYLNYNKTKFEQCISQNIDATQTDDPLLDEASILRLTNEAKPDQKRLVSFVKQPIKEGVFVKAEERLNDLLKTSVVSQTIQKFVDNNDIKSWVETGLELYKKHNSEECEFCGAKITEERIAKLEGHFNDEYRSFQERLEKADQWLSSQYVQLPSIPSESDLYDELKGNLVAAINKLEDAKSDLNKEIAAWAEVFDKKTKNPLEVSLKVNGISSSLIKSFNDALDDIDAVVEKHNYKSKNFREETTKAKKKLELHFATSEVKEFGYHDKKEGIKKRTEANSSLGKTIKERRKEIRILEDSLSNEGLGAEQFNDCLHKFLGRTELSLRFNKDKKGYEIIRNEDQLVAGKLSEGEKTAIAFVYFIIKLRENDNKIEETIVVVDDPVSSFDSNHLFHAYSFLRNNCDKAKQLFVLTHNFTYFKLIRDWFEGVNRNRRKKKPPRDPNAFFYNIESSTSAPRQSLIKDADPSLVNYNSEYHYIFSRLYSYKDNQSLSRDDAFLTANLSRKLLESFFSFKFPKHRSDISQLMTCGLKGCDVTDETIKEKIYRFINKYSHSVVIEVNEDSSENLVGESHNVISDIFTWLREVDQVHYDEMLEVIN